MPKYSSNNALYKIMYKLCRYCKTQNEIKFFEIHFKINK